VQQSSPPTLAALGHTTWTQRGLLPAHGVTEVITPDTPPDDAARVGDLIGEHGLELVVLSHSAALDRGDEEALSALRRQLDHCARLGARVLVDMSCSVPGDYDRYLDLMRAGAPLAAARGVTIAVKPHGGLVWPGPPRTCCAPCTRSTIPPTGSAGTPAT
jgi:hypothetical protein